MSDRAFSEVVRMLKTKQLTIEQQIELTRVMDRNLVVPIDLRETRLGDVRRIDVSVTYTRPRLMPEGPAPILFLNRTQSVQTTQIGGA